MKTRTLLLLAVVVAAIWAARQTGEPSRPEGASVTLPETAAPGAPVPGAPASRQPAPQADALAGSPESAGSVDPPGAVSPVPGAWPITSFSPTDYERTTMEIFRGFWREALAWTYVDYLGNAANREVLDGEQAYQVYVYLRTCLSEPRTEAALERRIARYERSRRLTPDRRDALIDARTEGLMRCAGLEEFGDLNLLALDWLTVAGERGYPQAQVAYYKSSRWLLNRTRDAVFREPALAWNYRDRATAFLLRALESGHPDALLEFSDAVRDAIVVPEDPIAAYAYAYAASLAADGDHDEANDKLAEIAAELEPSQVREGRVLGRQICDRYCPAINS